MAGLIPTHYNRVWLPTCARHCISLWYFLENETFRRYALNNLVIWLILIIPISASITLTWYIYRPLLSVRFFVTTPSSSYQVPSYVRPKTDPEKRAGKISTPHQSSTGRVGSSWVVVKPQRWIEVLEPLSRWVIFILGIYGDESVVMVCSNLPIMAAAVCTTEGELCSQ